MGNGGEALVVCSEKSMATGITIWDIETGDHLLHIPTCASPPNGLLCLRNHFLFASQIHRHGSVGRGAIFIWHLNKPQQPVRSYPMEAIGPLSCTKDSVYLAGGALSGNAYIWEAASGKLLKTWRAHHRSLTSLLFSHDGSLLISGSDDGMICVWRMISLLDVEDSGSSPSFLHYLDHNSSITGLATTTGISSPILVSSSLDGTCKVSDLVLGRVLQTVVYPIGITAIVLDLTEELVFFGSLDGRIFINMLDIGLMEDPFSLSQGQPAVIQGHNGAITALTISQSGLISASEDCTITIWDATHWTITRKFNQQKGGVSNLAVIPRSSLLSAPSNRKASTKFRVSPLDKYPQPANSSKETITFLSSSCSPKESQSSILFQSNDSCQQILDLQLQKEWTPAAAMKMKVETSLENRMWAMKMAKQVMEMNRHLQSRLLDLMQSRLLRSKETNSPNTKRRKKLMNMVEGPSNSNTNDPQFQGED